MPWNQCTKWIHIHQAIMIIFFFGAMWAPHSKFKFYIKYKPCINELHGLEVLKLSVEPLSCIEQWAFGVMTMLNCLRSLVAQKCCLFPVDLIASEATYFVIKWRLSTAIMSWRLAHTLLCKNLKVCLKRYKKWKKDEEKTHCMTCVRNRQCLNLISRFCW